MLLFGLLMILLQGVPAYAQEETTAAPKTPAAGATSSDSSDYEIDYEEEPESVDQSADTGEGAEEPPAPVKGKKKPTKKAAPRVKADRNAPALTGTRSTNRFAPILKSDTKSIYKKNGKALDVDTD
ncbi:MAG: hypothetical protein JST80_03990 [Bdellovibrionales bacterium]|nr:hypothetical protein [Bdellovibrionales bacterium]